MFFFFKQRTAYGMRISDWSSDVCSSDLGWQGEGALIPESIIGHQLARDARELRFDREGNEDLAVHCRRLWRACRRDRVIPLAVEVHPGIARHLRARIAAPRIFWRDRKSTRLNSSH